MCNSIIKYWCSKDTVAFSLYVYNIRTPMRRTPLSKAENTVWDVLKTYRLTVKTSKSERQKELSGEPSKASFDVFLLFFLRVKVTGFGVIWHSKFFIACGCKWNLGVKSVPPLSKPSAALLCGAHPTISFSRLQESSHLTFIAAGKITRLNIVH